MALDRLDGRSLLIFAGKGGVGKTTCSAATALHLAAAGKKTLLVTVDPAKRLEDSLGVPLDSVDREILPNLHASMLDPEQIIRAKLAEYSEGERVMEHPLFRYVTNYLPGLNELMAIGRLNEIRHESAYDVIVIDTAPTGHALSFLSAPKAIQELMSEKSLLRWALRGHAVWQRFQKTGRTLGRLFGQHREETTGRSASTEAEDIDLEDVFEKLATEAKDIQAMLTDPERTALNIVTLPEKLPVEETIDLHDHAVTELGIHVGYILVNKVQPDALGAQRDTFFALANGAQAREHLAEAFRAADQPPELLEAMLTATAFNDLRRAMNLQYIQQLEDRLPTSHRVLLPLMKEDVEGLDKLAAFEKVLFAGGP